MFIQTSESIRLANCPVFYKLIGHNHDLIPSSNFIEGEYVQACYIRSLLDELKQKTLKYPEQIKRAINHEEFTTLTGSAHIGSRADVYKQILDHVHNVLPSGVVVIALEEENRSR